MAFFSIGALAHSAALHEAKLYELNRFNRYDFARLKGKAFTLVFFQTNCPPCRDQLKALKCFKEKSPQAVILAVGIGETKDLAKEAKHLKLNFPALESTPNFLEIVHGVTSTPLTLRVDEKGEIVSRDGSTQTCDALIKRGT